MKCVYNGKLLKRIVIRTRVNTPVFKVLCMNDYLETRKDICRYPLISWSYPASTFGWSKWKHNIGISHKIIIEYRPSEMLEMKLAASLILRGVFRLVCKLILKIFKVEIKPSDVLSVKLKMECFQENKK